MDYIDALPLYMSVADSLPLTIPVDIIAVIASFMTVTQEFEFDPRSASLNRPNGEEDDDNDVFDTSCNAPKHIQVLTRPNNGVHIGQSNNTDLSVRSLQQEAVEASLAGRGAGPYRDFTFPQAFPRQLAIEHSRFLGRVESTARFYDQGWGNKKASILLYINRNCLMACGSQCPYGANVPAQLHGPCDDDATERWNAYHFAPEAAVSAAYAAVVKGDANAHDDGRQPSTSSANNTVPPPPPCQHTCNMAHDAKALAFVDGDDDPRWRVEWLHRIHFCSRESNERGREMGRARGWPEEVPRHYVLQHSDHESPTFATDLQPGDAIGVCVCAGPGGGHRLQISHLSMQITFAVGENLPVFLADFIDAHRRDKTLRLKLPPRPTPTVETSRGMRMEKVGLGGPVRTVSTAMQSEF